MTMKKRTANLILPLMLAASIHSTPVLAHADHGKAQYGGVVAEAGEAQLELVGAAGKLVVHVSNHGAPLPTTGATGKLTVLEGSSKRELVLSPAGDNRMEAAGNIAKGARVLINVQLSGQKALQARAVMP
jgi:hypothetical protein